MSEYISAHITEGRAYHKGDLILLRPKHDLDPVEHEFIQTLLTVRGDQLGVTFLMLPAYLEVVEPES
jgi:hypothetical protein